MKAWLNGIGWHTPAGSGLGHSSSGSPLVAGALKIPTRKQIFSEPDKRFGRLDDFSRVGLAAAAFCLRDGERDRFVEARSMGIVAASRYGCLATDIAYLETMLPDGGKFASPNLFAYTLANSFLGEVALRFGLGGNSLVINQQDSGCLAAVHYALEELAMTEQIGMLAGICDLPCARFDRPGAIPGALFVLLEKDPGPQSYGCLQKSGNTLYLNETPVNDLADLVSCCRNRR